MRQNLLRRLQAFFAPEVRRTAQPRRTKPRLENLEDRTTPSVTATYVGAISVTDGPDVNSSRATGPQSETAIAVNPTNPANIITGANDIFSIFSSPGHDNVWVTQNGGTSWRQVRIPTPAGIPDGSGDPTVVFDRTGRAVYAHLAFDTQGNLLLASAASTDGGLSWTAGKVKLPPGGFNDREYLAVGPDWMDPTRDRFYLAWHAFNVIYMSSSLDGLNWSKPTKVSDASTTNLFSQPAVGPNGEIYITWFDFGASGEAQLVFDRSFNGGKTWGRDVMLPTSNVNLFFDPLNGRYTVAAQPFRGISACPWIDVDRSNGPNRGRVYVSYTHATNGITNQVDHDNTDVYLVYSDNAQDLSTRPTFSTPLKVNDDTGNASQFLPVLAVDQTTGLVGMGWYDTRDDTANNRLTHYYGAISTNGGASFLPNFRYSDAQTDIFSGQDGNDYGDYSGLVFLGGTLFPCWSDGSNSTGDNPDGTAWRDVYTSPAVVTSAGGLSIVADGGPGNDTYTFRLDASGKFLQVFENDPSMTGGPALIINRASVRTIVVNGNAGDDTVVLDLTNGNPLPTNGVQFNGADGDDTLRLANTANAVTLPANAITFLGGAGSNTLDISITGPLTMPANAVTFTGGAGDDILSIAAGSLTITGMVPFTFDGAAGNDTVMLSIDDLTAPDGGFVFNGGAGNDRFVTSLKTATLPLTSSGPAFTFNGGDDDDTLSVTSASLTLPGGGFEFDGGDGDDSMTAAFDSVTIAALPDGTLGPIFNFDAGTGNDTLAMTGTSLALPENGFVYTAGEGNDRLELASPTPFANLPAGLLTGNLFDGGPGDDALALTAASLTLPTGGFTFTGNAGNDVLEIWATLITVPAGGLPTFTFDGNGGDDKLILKGATLKQTDAGFAFNGGDGSDRLEAAFSKVEVAGTGAAFSFDAGTGNDVLALFATTLELPAAAFTYSAGAGDDTLELAFNELKGVTTGLTFDGGAGNDFMSMTATNLKLPANGFSFLGGADDDRLSFATPNLTVPGGAIGFTFDGGDGTGDTLVTPGAGTRNWLITGPNLGTMNRGLFFQNIENAIGGDGADSFVFTAAGRFNSVLDGGPGLDSINLANFANVTFALTGANVQGGFNASYAGPLAGNVLGINSVIAGASPLDVLVGAPAGGVWSLGPNGGSYSSGTALSFSGFNVYRGGQGADAFHVNLAAAPLPPTGMLIDGAGGSDSLNVRGSALADSFVVGQNSLTVNGRTITFLRGEALGMDGGAGNDRFNATSTSMVFASLVMRGGVGSDLFVVTPPTTTSVQVFGDAPNTLSGGDTLRVSRAGAVLVGAKPPRTAQSGTLSFAGRRSIFFAGIESYDAGGTLISPN